MLTDFLLARIGEDEAAARVASHDGADWTDAPRGGWGNGAVETTNDDIVVYDEGSPSPQQAAHIARHDPARVLAECEAKRRIVETIRRADAIGDPARTPREWLLRELATVYADHPDYREEWRA